MKFKFFFLVFILLLFSGNILLADEVLQFDADTQEIEGIETPSCPIPMPSPFAQKAEGILNINGTRGGQGFYVGCNRLKISGLADLDGRYSNHWASNTVPMEDKKGSIYLNNVNALFDLNVNQFIHAHVGLAYLDKNFNPFFSQYHQHLGRSFATFSQTTGLDEFYFSFRDFDRHPLFLKLGRYFLPFGDQNQEPYPLIRSLPQLLTQVRDTAVEGGFIAEQGVYTSLLVVHPVQDAPKKYPYEPVFNRTEISNFLGRAGVSQNIGDMDFNLSGSFIWDIRSVQFVEDLYSPYFQNSNFQRAAAIAGHADVTLGQVVVAGDVVAVTRPLILANKETRPIAYAVTGGYIFDVMGHESVAHLGYQGTSYASSLFLNPNYSRNTAYPFNGYAENDVRPALPRWRLKADYRFEINAYANVAFEYVYDRAYHSIFDSPFKSTHTVATRFSIAI